MRSPFQRDRDRIIHSTAFRRLKHKTQVFVYHEGDHYRTRLTHSLEVAQIARTVARALGLDEDLAEALALAHDLGHTPFGHAGEEALNDEMRPYGGFSHNDQTLRILTRLERRYAEFDGLNLTWETLEGTVKHNGPLCGSPGSKGRCRPRSPNTTGCHPLDLRHLSRSRGAGRRARRRHRLQQPRSRRRAARRAVRGRRSRRRAAGRAGIRRGRRGAIPGIEDARLIHEAIRRVIDRMVRDLIGETRRRLAGERRRRRRRGARARRRRSRLFRTRCGSHDRALKRFLFERMYRHPGSTAWRQRRAASCASCFSCFSPSRNACRAEWRRAARRRASAETRADRRRLPRRHDRPICPRRASPVVRYLRAGMTNPGMTEYFRRFSPPRDRGARRSGGAGRAAVRARFQRASRSSRRATRRMAISRPTPRWCWPAPSSRTRWRSPRRSPRRSPDASWRAPATAAAALRSRRRGPGF